jgi:hypothetical protein
VGLRKAPGYLTQDAAHRLTRPASALRSPFGGFLRSGACRPWRSAPGWLVGPLLVGLVVPSCWWLRRPLLVPLPEASLSGVAGAPRALPKVGEWALTGPQATTVRQLVSPRCYAMAHRGHTTASARGGLLPACRPRQVCPWGGRGCPKELAGDEGVRGVKPRERIAITPQTFLLRIFEGRTVERLHHKTSGHTTNPR